VKPSPKFARDFLRLGHQQVLGLEVLLDRRVLQGKARIERRAGGCQVFSSKAV